MLDIEKQMVEGLAGCFFRFNEEMKVRNVGDGIPPWESKKAIQKKVEPVSAVPPKPVPPSFPPGTAPKVSDVVAAVAFVSEVSEKEIMGKRRVNKTVKARQAVMRLSRKLFPQGWAWFGRRLGVDHSTVLHACVYLKPEHAAKVDPIVEAALEVLRSQFTDLDAVLTKVEAYRNQTVTDGECHASQTE